MSILNEKTPETVKNIHLAVTPFCLHNCKYCCNKFYSWNDVSVITDEELKSCENLFITGGEPFAFARPEKIAKYYHKRYVNIKKIIIYTNAYEFYEYILRLGFLESFGYIDGFTISIKSKEDLYAWEKLNIFLEDSDSLRSIINSENTRVYVFDGYEAAFNLTIKNPKYALMPRNWQKEFKPALDSIFRKIF